MILSHLPGPVLKPAPGYAHLLAIKILHHDNFLPSSKLVPRHCASAFFKLHLPGEIPGHLETLYRDTLTLNKIYCLTAKTRAIPSLHRDNFPAKEPRLCPVLASGNTTSLYCRAVSKHAPKIRPRSLHISLSILTRYTLRLFRTCYRRSIYSVIISGNLTAPATMTNPCAASKTLQHAKIGCPLRTVNKLTITLTDSSTIQHYTAIHKPANFFCQPGPLANEHAF